MVSAEEVRVQGDAVARVDEILDDLDGSMNGIMNRLAELKENVVGPSTLAVAGSQEVTILADRSVPFLVIRKIMSTCTEGGYENVSLAVVQKPTRVASN